MDKKEKTQSSSGHTEKPVEWKLTEEDKAFLRSCNISPD